MIGSLTGVLAVKRPPALVLDVHGVGYELEAPMTTFYELPNAGTEVTLHTHLVVREDAQLLYGFTSLQQRDLFRNLLKVSGVGPRVALAVLSGLTSEDFVACMAAEDVDRLTRVPGIGRKTAQRLIVEMRDRITKQMEGVELSAAPAPGAGTTNPIHDAVSALIALGYKPVEASRAIRALAVEGLTSEEIIREALRHLAGSAA
ncbi:MAG: Holliday junction branch migration protein RuvA [Gammaproteobacteria bacterium]|nr:Holliday junction branch migration protein RuvA [Gammaproteobacteria bacterium]